MAARSSAALRFVFFDVAFFAIVGWIFVAWAHIVDVCLMQ